MKNQKKSKLSYLTSTLLILVLMFTTTSFSFADKEVKEQQKTDDESIVYLYRLKSFVGGAVAWVIFIQEFDAEKKIFSAKKKLGKLKQKQYMPITVKPNTMYYIQVGTMQKILVLVKDNAKMIVQLKGMKIKATAKDNFALVKLGAGDRVGASNIAELILQTGINKSNRKKFEENKFTWLEPIDNNPDYKEMLTFKNCLKN